MPSGNPQFGETWVIRDTSGHEITGFVADANDQIVTLVSLTGMRHRVAPARMPMTWRYSRAMPTGGLHQCQREGCANYAILCYPSRDAGEPDFHVCPRHLPIGVSSRIVTEAGSLPEGVLETIPCPNCSNRDTVEDRRYLRPTPQVTFMSCIMCSYRWANIEPADHHPPSAWYTEHINSVLGLVRQHGVEPVELRIGDGVWVVLNGGGLISGTPSRRFMGSMNAILDAQLPRDTVVLRIRGEPAPPRAEAPRPIQRLGGQPASTMGTPSSSSMRQAFDTLYGVGRPRQTLPELADIVRAARHPPEATISDPPFESDEHLTPIGDGSRWAQRKSGLLIEVVRCERTTDRSLMVVFRALEEHDVGHTHRMLQRDFLRHHRPYQEVVQTIKDVPSPTVIVLANEEYESVNGESIIVVSVDTKRAMVMVEEPLSKRRRQIGLVEFAGDQWRKIVRKTAYDRLNSDDEETL